jgi:hypothetical protein
MVDDVSKVSPHFAQLVLSLQAGGMQQLGKVASPISGKIERDLEMAKVTINMLAMMQEKTKGNLTDEEEKLLANLISQLRLNYVDEVEKEKTSPAAEKSEETPSESSPPEKKERK